ncbi:sensor domain-containing protein [Ornithinibacillus californiensis]|uniref:sensor domain-containing protein n=1 Tax=Ornithinibacillus californiensis TaxID=161536 RepID=UPI00069E3D28|nr:EAL domain-containing protein [Ornithinibacillus californiensis]
MHNEQISFPLNVQLLSFFTEPILFVKDNGTIIEGNDEAYSILNINKTSGNSIADYIDFHLLKESTQTHLLMEMKKGNGKILEVKSLQISGDLYCLIVNELSLQNRADELKRYFNQISNNSTEGIVLYTNSIILDCDETFATMFSYTKEEMLDITMDQLIESKSYKKLKNDDREVIDGVLELKGVRKDGTSFYIEMVEYPYYKNGKIVRAASVKDITERIENENKIEYMAYYDELTDLPNRNFFNKVLKEAIVQAEEAGEQLAVFFLDIDYFKEINDTLGYSFGDKLLQACAGRLKSFLQMDTFIARMSGDEFLILQRNTTKADATELAEKLISEFEKPITIDDYEIYTTVSIGISIYPDNGNSVSDLIKHADSAMYVIKEKHRNYYNLFESSISENFRTMLTMETEMRKALKDGQFELHYQPQKDLMKNEVVGLEALIRWNHPERGYISPIEFIPLAEKTGLIIDIGDWVLSEACRQNKEWQDKGFTPITVSVNLSAKQFHQRNLVEKVNDILDETGLDPHYLELEITERMAMSNEEEILETLYALRELGVLVSIDDFGTGYSSFKYLSVFPITKLKIDRMFLNEQQKQNQAIVKSIIHMSHSLNMKVIAEGVETIEQLDFLTSERCDEMQGYLFSKPLPPKELTKFLA